MPNKVLRSIWFCLAGRFCLAGGLTAGASVVVLAPTEGGRRCLLLHRSHGGAGYDGDWAWTPPAGGREPGESASECASRELWEETGLTGELLPVEVDGIEWAVFRLVLPAPCDVVLDDDHDRYEWVSVEEACRRCLPAVVADSVRKAARLA